MRGPLLKRSVRGHVQKDNGHPLSLHLRISNLLGKTNVCRREGDVISIYIFRLAEYCFDPFFLGSNSLVTAKTFTFLGFDLAYLVLTFLKLQKSCIARTFIFPGSFYFSVHIGFQLYSNLAEFLSKESYGQFGKKS